MALIALGVCGGIGAYKAVEIARGLQKRGHDVTVVMTRSARRFVGPVTFEAISRRRVITDQFAEGANSDIEHIALASNAGLLLVAPATANVIGKFANGIADDFLTSLYLATRAPVLMAPAMNTNMLDHDAVRANMDALRARGVRFVEPGEGYLACGWIGKGRLAEPDDVVAAGPTYEDIDDVRYIGNRSSGKMGYALAIEAARRGARVLLVSGPGSLPAPNNVELVRVRSAAQMHTAVMAQAAHADMVIMAAAVADYTPRARRDGKIAKSDGDLALDLVPTRDILADLGAARTAAGPRVIIGFAAESGEPVARARKKLAAKKADMIVANDITRTDAGFDADTNAVTLVTAAGAEPVALASKAQVAGVILDRGEALLGSTATR